VSSGFNVSYNGLGNDLEGVNFSSIRAGVLDERDSWMDLQAFFIENVLEPIHDEWISMALLSGAMTLGSGKALPAVKLDQFKDHTFTGRRWQWVDPTKDGEANRLAVQDGSKSRTQVAAEQGRDFYEIVDELAQENEYAKSKGVTLGAVEKALASPAAAPADA
jgi:lambda family phage portal protein